jgi:hypothetical protein
MIVHGELSWFIDTTMSKDVSKVIHKSDIYILCQESAVFWSMKTAMTHSYWPNGIVLRVSHKEHVSEPRMLTDSHNPMHILLTHLSITLLMD